MNRNITNEQIQNWLNQRAAELAESDPRTADLRDNCAFKLGILESTFASLLNSPHQRRELVKEIAK